MQELPVTSSGFRRALRQLASRGAQKISHTHERSGQPGRSLIFQPARRCWLTDLAPVAGRACAHPCPVAGLHRAGPSTRLDEFGQSIQFDRIVVNDSTCRRAVSRTGGRHMFFNFAILCPAAALRRRIPADNFAIVQVDSAEARCYNPGGVGILAARDGIAHPAGHPHYLFLHVAATARESPRTILG